MENPFEKKVKKPVVESIKSDDKVGERELLSGQNTNENFENESESLNNFYNSLLYNTERNSVKFWSQYENNEYIKDLLFSGKLHEKIKQEFISGNIDIGQLRDILFYVDQYGDHMETSGLNIQLLEDKGVESAFVENVENMNFDNEEEKQIIMYNLYRMKSMAYFHNAQGRTLKGENPEKEFELAHQEAEKVMTEDFYLSWKLYTEGTVCYFKKDKERLKEIIKLTSEMIQEQKLAIEKSNEENAEEQKSSLWGLERNNEILENFLDSLEENEEPSENYVKAYSKRNN